MVAWLEGRDTGANRIDDTPTHSIVNGFEFAL